MEWKKFKETLWGSKEEQGADPDDLSIENAYRLDGYGITLYWDY